MKLIRYILLKLIVAVLLHHTPNLLQPYPTGIASMKYGSESIALSILIIY